MRTGWAAVRFGWVAYVIPFAFVASPALLLIGETGDIVLTTLAAFIGVWLVSIGVVGYFVRPIGIVPRALFAVAGLLMLAPEVSYLPVSPHLFGVALGAGLLARELMVQRHARGAASGSAADG
jgi:TRAP-type uncharacterized transport system fused permease subunit